MEHGTTPDPLRVVFDTGVVLQAALRPAGPAGRLFALLDERCFELCISEAALTEYQDVLARPAIRRKNPHLTQEWIAAIIARIRACAAVVAEPPNAFVFARDSDDEHVLNLAISAGAKFLITRDRDLLDLMIGADVDALKFREQCPGVSIIDPVAFIGVLASRDR
ncbi:MAG: putative toxin-antitoxin system toxin component, PIN family [Actinomycetota bacterium]